MQASGTPETDNDPGEPVSVLVSVLVSKLPPKLTNRFAIVIMVTCQMLASSVQPLAAQEETPAPEPPKIAKASEEAQNAIQVFKLPAGVIAEVFAAEPDVANPVAIDVDSQNRVWVCESFRQENGIEDNRNHPEWLQDDLAAKTVADRLAYIKKHLGDKALTYTQQDDRIRLLVDSDRDGVADQSTIFADRFNAIEEGTGAGILSYRGDVFYTCIPKLWKLKDVDGDNVADEREVMHDGYGVRFAFRGHDLHGLIIGPDGRIYFSVGDRGYHINDQISDPSSGAVFRCEMDGSDLQVIHTGLRNPQELAFDNYGNLFTGDNNSDSGDKARMVYVVQGGDSGWRMHYQYLPDRGPFNREKIWHPIGGPAYRVPPIDNFADGPSGFAFYPGTGFSDHMNDRFLLCDFRGQTSGSGIKTFRLKPNGAFFEIADEENTFWNILATDCCFGPDGCLYVSDWVHGWDGLGKGRVYRLQDRLAEKTNTQELLEFGWSTSSPERIKMANLFLEHSDRRVRQMAQFELAANGDALELGELIDDNSNSQMQRMHALWALDQVCRRLGPPGKNAKQSDANWQAHFLMASMLVKLTGDADAELRAQSAKLAADFFASANPEVQRKYTEHLPRLLKDESHRVRYFAAICLGKVADHSLLPSIFKLLENKRSTAPMIFHAGVMAFVHQTKLHGGAALRLGIDHESPNVRLAAVVACRKLALSEPNEPNLDGVLLEALKDSDEEVVLEAARAIHDVPVNSLMLDLAKLEIDNKDDALVRRVINANFRIGDIGSLLRIKSLILREDLETERRLDCVNLLAEWNNPPPLDKVLGCWRPLDSEVRRAETPTMVRQLIAYVDKLPVEVAAALIDSAVNLKVTAALPELVACYKSESEVSIRESAFKGLVAFANEDSVAEELLPLINKALTDENESIRIAALIHLANRDFGVVENSVGQAIMAGTTRERQNAFQILGKSESPMAETMMLSMLDNFQQINQDAQLDLVLAAQEHSKDTVMDRIAVLLRDFETPEKDFQQKLTMHGGDAESGSKIFYERTDVSCLRCHKIQGSGGDVGPNLSDIGLTRDRNYLLESLVQPGKTITENFETVVVLDVDGKVHVGVTKASTDEVLSIMTADAIMVNIPQGDIEEIRRGDSAMPDDVMKHLTLKEMRDLIEFLASRKEPDATLKK